LSYQWYKGTGTGSPVSDVPSHIAGSNTATLSFSNAGAGDAGAYHVSISSATCGTTADAQTSPGVRTLTVDTAPVISNVLPSSSSICVGSSTSFTVSTSAGTLPLSYQWYKGSGTGSPVSDVPSHISGSNTATLAFTNAVVGDSAGYHVVVSSVSCTPV